ncbi:hypothetical protein MBLNU230_g4537t1 [Neophaeotheca triangularis]
MSYEHGGKLSYHESTVSASSEEDGTHLPLSAEINKATQSAHTSLNRLITARIETFLANRHNPEVLEVYSLALIALQSLYANFENAHTAFIHNHTSQTPPSPSPHIHALHSALTHLPPVNLPRAPAFAADYAHLHELFYRSHGWEAENAASNHGYTYREFRDSTARNTAYILRHHSSYLSTLAPRLAARPHLYLAHAHCLYMAIFSGGRYVRARLASAGPDFWLDPGLFTAKEEAELRGLSGTPTAMPGFSFLSFPGADDGLELKRVFKERFAVFDGLLSEGERREIVAEAEGVFAFLLELVVSLDGCLGRRQRWERWVWRKGLVWAVLLLPVLVVAVALLTEGRG